MARAGRAPVEARLRAPGGRVGKLTERVRQLEWIPYCLDDVRSDLSVLHRIDELEEMPAPLFFSYCYRLPAYQGVVANRYRRQHEASAPQAAQQARTMSLAEWAAQHPHEMEAAYERAAEGR